jgi:nicotinamidase-related amidase
MQNKKALLIIDMQKGSFTPKTPRFDTDGVVNRINELARIFREAGFPVIYIQHDGTKANEFIPNSEEWELLDILEVEPSDIMTSKTANDSFYNSNLDLKLKELNINELLITGCATDFCVESTIQSALAKDYNIIVVSDGHTTGNRPHLSAEKVIEHYNWVWQNMVPTKGTIKVMYFEEILKTLELTK